MKNLYITTLLFILIGQLSFAQVQINVTEGQEESSALLQIDATDKGVSFPNVALTSTIDLQTVSNPVAGLLVYNINTESDVSPGFYFYYNNAWHPIGKMSETYLFNQPIDKDVLGYTPTNLGKTADNTIGTVHGTIGNRWRTMGCETWSVSEGGNGHTYCAYWSFTPVVLFDPINRDHNWEQAYNFAQDRGGYLLTLTSDEEREWVMQNIVADKGLSSNIWLGYRSFESRYVPMAGNNNDTHNGISFNRHRYKWVTNEKWVADWEEPTTATVQHNFINNQPTVGNARCTYIQSSGQRQWTTRTCNTATGANHIIVEFQDTY